MKIDGTDTLNAYLRDIGKYKPLKIEEEKMLAQEIRNGNKKSLDKLVTANLRFVVSVARKYEHQGIPLLDLINEGNIGLIKAAKRFDEKKDFKFISYALWWIRQSILTALAENSRIYKLNPNEVSKIHNWGKAYGVLEQKYQRPPTLEEIGEYMKISTEEARRVFEMNKNPVYIDSPLIVGEESDHYSVMKSDAELPDEMIKRKSLKNYLSSSVFTFSNNDTKVLLMHKGLSDYDVPLSYAEIADITKSNRKNVKEAVERAERNFKILLRDPNHLEQFYN